MRNILDTITNLAVLVASVMICIWVLPQVRQRWSGDTWPAMTGYAVSDTGPQIVDYGRSPKTVVLFVRSTCRYCTESMPFYKELAASSRRAGGFRLVIASTEPKETTGAYLGQHEVTADEIVTMPQDPKIPATPTLLVVDR